ncbi:hypothetical protein P7C73_g4911, partial [Tremellales sp. Uapishka_1]
MRVAFALPILLLSLASPCLAESSTRSAQQIVQDANRLLAEGSYVDAARAYGEAIGELPCLLTTTICSPDDPDLEPSSYINYYKRATAYLSLGRHSSALDDFDSILRLNPSFAQAHLQKAKILAKEGQFEKAQAELKAFGKTKSDPEATELASAVANAEVFANVAHKAARDKSWTVCVERATGALEVGPNSADLRDLRVKCSIELGDVDAVYGDLSRLASLNPSTLSLPLRLSNIAYFMLASPTAMNHIKQCLHYDPDSKPCKVVHKLLRQLDKETAKARNFVEGGTFRQAIKVLDGEEGLLAKFEQALLSADLPDQFQPKKKSLARLQLYAMACKAAVGAGDFTKSKGMKWCDETLAMDPENIDALVGKGEKMLKDENWEDAVRTFDKAFDLGGKSSQDVLGRLQKAQRLLKQSKAKDYYKVLGVPRDADLRTIKKAFRTAAKKAHPDVGGSEEKMAQLNEAYEVLSKEELRTRYDNGDDPNDQQQGQGHHNPFAHHGGGGMPFQFFQQQQGHGQKMHFQWGG